MMTLQQLQEQTDEWIRTLGVRYFDEKTNALLLVEEVGELVRYIAREYGEQSFKTGKKPDRTKDVIADEMGDVLFVLTCLANQMDIDLTEAVTRNFIKKTSRDASRHQDNDKLRTS